MGNEVDMAALITAIYEASCGFRPLARNTRTYSNRIWGAGGQHGSAGKDAFRMLVGVRRDRSEDDRKLHQTLSQREPHLAEDQFDAGWNNPDRTPWQFPGQN